MTFTQLRTIKFQIEKINEECEYTQAKLKHTVMFTDGKWATCISYNLLTSKQMKRINNLIEMMNLLVFYSKSGIQLQ